MGIFQRKKYIPIENVEDDCTSKHSDYSLFDLICVGVGATLGSGVFVLTGLVARDYAGPSAFFSWIIAGIACCFSAMSYAEMSNRMPSSGSSYTFVYSTLGELPAYITAWCLSLECGISVAAVARNWGVKLANYLRDPASDLSRDDFGFNAYSSSVMVCTVLLFLSGTEVSKLVINSFTVMKVLLVFFMIGGGFFLFRPLNMVPIAPMGIRGCLRGATSCFFGFVGYDEVCCLALESKNAKQHLPIAVFGTITIVSLLYAFSSLSLTGMAQYSSIDEQSGFSFAFYQHGYILAGSITAIGELVTLPLVVIVSFLPQSRVFYAMALDGLCPSVLAYRNSSGNFTYGVLFAGFICILIASFIPFTALDDVISAGVLFSFNLTNNSLLLTRCENSEDIPWRAFRWNRCQILLCIFNIQSFFISMLLNVTSQDYSYFRWISITLGICLLLMMGFLLKRDCIDRLSEALPAECSVSSSFPLESHTIRRSDSNTKGDDFYRVPWMPLPPLIGLFINYLLITQLSVNSFLSLFSYLLFAAVTYFVTR